MSLLEKGQEFIGNLLGARQSPSQVQSLSQSSVVLGLGIVGGLWIGLHAARFVQVLAELYVLPGISLTKFGAQPKNAGQGSWAVVTGATDGIGKEFALQLAKKGFNVLLASRTAAKLESVAQEIQAQSPGTKVDIVAIDFSAGDDAQYAVLEKKVKALDVGVLINNVGRSHNMPVPFVETPQEEMLAITEININATLRVTQIVGPELVRKQRGLILNLGSFAGQFPTPLLATYTGSKAFLIAYSQALGEELRRSNVLVQNINAYFITSNLSKIRRSSALIPTPKTYVAKVLTKIGRSGGAVGRPFNTTPFPTHGLADYFITSAVGATHWLLRFNYGTCTCPAWEMRMTDVFPRQLDGYAQACTQEGLQDAVRAWEERKLDVWRAWCART